MIRFRSSARVLALALPFLAACGGGGDDPTGPTEPPPPPPPPPPAAVATVSVAPGTADLVPAQSVPLSATTRDSAGNVLTGRAVTWSSGAPATATVGATGLVTAVAPGSATITATSEGRTATASITVADGGLLQPAGGTITAGGGSVAIDAPAGAVATNRPVTVAPVANPAADPLLLPGTAWSLTPADSLAAPVTIRIAWSADSLPPGALPELVRVHRFDGAAWVPLPLDSASASRAAGTDAAGTDAAASRANSTSPTGGRTSALGTFALIALPANPAPVLTAIAPDSAILGAPAPVVTLTGSDFIAESVVRVNGDPRPTTFVSATTLTVQLDAADVAAEASLALSVVTPAPGGGTSAALPLRVVPPAVATVTVSPDSARLVPAQTAQLTATTRDAGGTVLTGRAVTWSSSDAATASVSATGLVTAVAPGSATITATSEGITGTAQLIVADGGVLVPAGGAITAGSGNVVIDAPAGAVSAPRAVTVAAIADPPADPLLVPGTAWSLTPADSLAAAVTIQLAWSADSLPAGAFPELLRVHRFDGAAWVPLPTDSAGSTRAAVRGSAASSTANSTSPTGGRTRALGTFAIVALPANPAPVLTSIAPDSVIVGSDTPTLTLSGSDFIAESVVHVNGTPRPTAFVAGTTLTVQLEPGDVAQVATLSLTVVTPGPGGGTSTALPFRVVPMPIPVFTVTTTADAGAGSLRQAIADANARTGLDSIQFAIPGAGPHTIQPLSPLPAITDPVVLDGLSQPGAQCATWPATLRIEIIGTSTPLGSDGLTLAGGGATVRGLVINRFDDGNGIHVTSDGNAIGCNYLGVNVGGTTAAIARANNNEFGIMVTGGNGNMIGGDTPTMRNLVSGNDEDGIRLRSGATDNAVYGNFIGTDVTGTAAIENGEAGVRIAGGPRNRIGNGDHDAGVCNRTCNLISGNDDHGVEVQDDGGDETWILGNFIGTDVTGTTAVGNEQQGIDLDATSAQSGTRGHVIGGMTTPGACSGPCNLISGNGDNGIHVDSRLRDVTIQGNFVGTNAQGTVALPNLYAGVDVRGADHLIGGAAPGLGNVISGNSVEGLLMRGSGAQTARGNWIGVAADGVSPIGNSEAGVVVSGSDKRVGGTEPGEGNVIAHNTGGGIRVVDFLTGTGDGHTLLGNRIYSNGKLGIELCVWNGTSCDGVTPNDALDADDGMNRLQNFPTLNSAVRTDSLTVTGTLATSPNGTFRVELFASDALDPSGHGEGQRYLGFVTVTTDQNGNAAISVRLPTTGAPVGSFITATATDAAGNTSEFSAGIAVTQGGGS